MLKASAAELKHFFVRGRFAEANHFGNPDIEQWLEVQRTSRMPSEKGWGHLVSTLNGPPISIPLAYRLLHSYGYRPDSVSGDNNEHISPAYRSLVPLLSGLNSGNFTIYYSEGFGSIVVAKNPLQVFWFNSDDKRKTTLAIGKIGLSVVIDAILTTWRRWAPKAAEARKFLCDRLAENIKKVKNEAEADFDRAIAVTSDGTKIVIADWVSIVDGDREIVYRADVFRERKIERIESTFVQMLRGARPYSQPYSETMWNMLQKGGNTRYPFARQNFLEVRHRDIFLHLGGQMNQLTGRFFFTHRRHCAEPLPTEGIVYDSVKKERF